MSESIEYPSLAGKEKRWCLFLHLGGIQNRWFVGRKQEKIYLNCSLGDKFVSIYRLRYIVFSLNRKTITHQYNSENTPIIVILKKKNFFILLPIFRLKADICTISGFHLKYLYFKANILIYCWCFIKWMPIKRNTDLTASPYVNLLNFDYKIYVILSE